MIPLRDENPTKTVPYAVYALIIINVLIFLYNGTMRQSGNPLSGFELVPNSLFGGTPEGAPVPAWFTVFTSMFMHANLLHIAGNMLYLWIFGNNIEDAMGHVKFLVFYILSGMGAAFAQAISDPGSTIPMVGASGAIAGVLGAYIILYPRARVLTAIMLFYFIRLVHLPASVVLGFWIVLQIINSAIMAAAGVGGGVAYMAHIGGFAAGAVLIMLFGGRRLVRSRQMPGYWIDRGWQ